MINLIYLPLIIHLICPLPPLNSIESPKIFESRHYLTTNNTATMFNLMRYKNNSEQRIRATYQIKAGGECTEYKTGIIEAGQQVGSSSTIIYYSRLEQGNGDLKIYVQILE